MKNEKIIKNSVWQLLSQIITIIVNLIVPPIMIRYYGASQYGLTVSITSFLSYIVLLESGIGGITRSLLYKPLSKKNILEVSAILKKSEKFYKKLSLIFLFYSTIIALIYPIVINRSYGALFTGSLVIIIAISSFAQYYFGIVYFILLQSDQKIYVNSIINILVITLNTIVIIVFIKIGLSLHMVKLISTIIFVIKPFALRYYVRKRYKIIETVEEIEFEEKQKKAGIVQNIAWFLHSNTDPVILTIFETLKSVTIYSIYNMPIKALSGIVTSIVSSTEATFGYLLAVERKEVVNEKFRVYILFNNSLNIVMFSTTLLMLDSFIALYTKKLNDSEYIIPILGYMLTISELLYCLRRPYYDIVTAAGHFKETENSAIIETVINVVLSILLVKSFGIKGAAVATLIAMLYRLLYLIIYISRNIICFNLKESLKMFLNSIFQLVLIVLLSHLMKKFNINTYIEWLIMSVKEFILAISIVILTNLLFYRKVSKDLYLKIYKSKAIKKVEK